MDDTNTGGEKKAWKAKRNGKMATAIIHVACEFKKATVTHDI